MGMEKSIQDAEEEVETVNTQVSDGKPETSQETYKFSQTRWCC